MDEALGQRHSISPPVLISSIPEDEPGPSSEVASPTVERKERKEKVRKRSQGDAFDLLREEMERERERDERREKAREERSKQLYALLDQLVKKIN